jgi:hypothetical protein
VVSLFCIEIKFTYPNVHLGLKSLKETSKMLSTYQNFVKGFLLYKIRAAKLYCSLYFLLYILTIIWCHYQGFSRQLVPNCHFLLFNQNSIVAPTIKVTILNNWTVYISSQKQKNNACQFFY